MGAMMGGSKSGKRRSDKAMFSCPSGVSIAQRHLRMFARAPTGEPVTGWLVGEWWGFCGVCPASHARCNCRAEHGSHRHSLAALLHE